MKKKPKAKKGSAASSRNRTETRRGIDKAFRAKKIRLLIADDHALILEGLAATIGRQDDMTVVAKASNGRQAVELWKMHRPDVSLLDLRMPTLDGVGVIR
jgi:CheY-like chemotaxis protein